MQTSLAEKAPFDVLALIFEICAEFSWRSPLRLGGVCRSWRSAVHRNPRLWSVVDVKSRRERHKAYFDRSGSYTLHLSVKKPDDIDEVEEVAHRVRCLTIPYFVDNMPEWGFPALTTLRCIHTDTGGPWVDMSQITTMRFPNLRHLEIVCTYPNPQCDDLPPLESLDVYPENESEWEATEAIIAACSASLVTLYIMGASHTEYQSKSPIKLPKLRCLKIDTAEDIKDLPLDLRTPGLQVYKDANSYYEQLMHKDISSVTHLRLKRFEMVAFLTLSHNARVLQLKVSFSVFVNVLEELKKNSSLCSRLECLEFHSDYLEKDEMAKARQTLETFEWKDRVRMKPPTISDHWITNFPLLYVRECHPHLF